MTFEEIIRDLKNKVYHPVYFLFGNEPYYIDQISEYIEQHVLEESEKEFNQTVLYGRDCDVLSLVSMAKRFPMMANYQVLIVKEAQEIKNLIPKKEKDDQDSPLINYLSNPQRSTLLVLCFKHKSIDKRTRFAKAVLKNSCAFESSKLYDNQIPGWIINFLKAKNTRIEEQAAILLAEYLGTDLSRIVNELEKLSVNLEPGQVIDTGLVEKYVGISKEYNVFELQKAIGVKNPLKAGKVINYFIANPKNNPLVLTLGSLSSYFNKLLQVHMLTDRSEKNVAAALGINYFFAKEYLQAASRYPVSKLVEIFSLLREYDVRSKGVNNESTGDGELLRELVFKIVH